MPSISILSLVICLFPCAGVAWISYRWAGRGGELVYAVLRMAVQLILIGFALVFLFETDEWLIGACVVTLMVVFSAIISVRMTTMDRGRVLRSALVALVIAGGSVLLLVYAVVLEIRDPWYQPRILIPIAGMIFSNAMTAITLAAERLENDLAGGEEFVSARKAAWTAAMIPQINALLAVGLVSLPGMMTGQILSGVDPLVAVRYQIVVMAMVLQASGFGVAIFLSLAKLHGGARRCDHRA